MTVLSRLAAALVATTGLAQAAEGPVALARAETEAASVALSTEHGRPKAEAGAATEDRSPPRAVRVVYPSPYGAAPNKGGR